MALVQILNGRFQDMEGSPLALGTLVFELSHDEQEPISTQPSGTVGTSGTTVTWLTGTQFNSTFNGAPITINGTVYTVLNVISPMTLQLTGSAGTQTGPYSASTPTGQVVSGLKRTVLLDANGNVPASPITQLWANSELTPAGSYYTVVGYDSTGRLAWGPQYLIIGDTSPYDLGLAVPTNPPGGLSGGGGGGSSVEIQTNGTDNASQTLLNFVNSGSVTFTNTSGGNVTATASGGGGGVSGSGTAGSLPIWTGAASLGNSSVTDNNAGTLSTTDNLLQYITSQTNAFLTTNGTVIGSSPTAGVNLILGTNTLGPSNTKGGNITLAPAVGTGGVLANNGAISLGAGSSSYTATYFSNITFSALAVPRANPTASSTTKGAIFFCTDAQGPQDGAVWGSTATGSGTGALVRYTGSIWVVIG